MENNGGDCVPGKVAIRSRREEGIVPGTSRKKVYEVPRIIILCYNRIFCMFCVFSILKSLLY